MNPVDIIVKKRDGGELTPAGGWEIKPHWLWVRLSLLVGYLWAR